MDPLGFDIVARREPTAVERLLAGLPDWFGIEESNRQYVADAGVKDSYLAVEPGSQKILGALLVSRHFPGSAEIHLLAVDAGHHRRGIGAALTQRFEADMRADGVRVLEVKTLGPSDPDEHYARTLAFYLAQGFQPLEELRGLWPGEPTLILVKPLG